jgi:hypothetical protein
MVKEAKSGQADQAVIIGLSKFNRVWVSKHFGKNPF